MPDKADTLELAEQELAKLIDVIHRQGISYARILWLLAKACETLAMQIDLEIKRK